MEQLTERRQQISASTDPKVNLKKALTELITGYNALIKECIAECQAAKNTLTAEDYEAKMAKLKEHHTHLTDYIEASKVERELAQDAIEVLQPRLDKDE